MDKLAKYVYGELQKISFFLQYSGVIEDHLPRNITKILLNLPVDWDQQHVLINDKPLAQVEKEEKEKPGTHYFERAGVGQKLPYKIEIKGKLIKKETNKSETFKWLAQFGDKEHFYSLEFENGKTFGIQKKIRNMAKIKQIIEAEIEGDHSEGEDLTEIYTQLFKNYSSLKNKIVSQFFGDFKSLDWQAKPRFDKEKNVIRLKIFAKDTTPEEYRNVFSILTSDDMGRAVHKASTKLKDVVRFVISEARSVGFNPDDYVFKVGITRPLLKKDTPSNEVGFSLSIQND